MPEHAMLQRSTLDVLSAWLESARSTGAVALIDKEEEWTSFDCVAKLRGMTKVKKVGHAGTLDPLATGLLILCFGRATKDIVLFQDADKAYDVTIKLGATTATDDRGAAETDGSSVPLDAVAIRMALQSFVGEIEQTPPDYAAVRHGGRRQYDLAREGREFVPKVRQVTVHGIGDVVIEWPYVHAHVRCSKGTYIRSIARDLGTALGCGGYVWSLRRTHIGVFDVREALTIGEIQEALRALTTA